MEKRTTRNTKNKGNYYINNNKNHNYATNKENYGNSNNNGYNYATSHATETNNNTAATWVEAENKGVKVENIKILGLEQKTDADNNKDNKISIEDEEKKTELNMRMRKYRTKRSTTQIK